jgi:hypothetical protein
VSSKTDVGEILDAGRSAVGESEPKADAPEVEPVRVPAQPLDLGCPPVAGDVRVADTPAAAGFELREQEAVDVPAVGIR